MKLLKYISLATLLTVCLFFTYSYAYGENNHSRNKKDYNKNYKNNDRNDKDKNYDIKGRNDHKNTNVIIINKSTSPGYSYKYRGKYRNFRNYNHVNRYYYNGAYYNFDDYYRHYSKESNVYTYEGSYGRHSDIFIFSDRYGNEFDLYLKPMKRAPIWLKVSPLRVGNPYRMRVRPTRYYPNSDEVRVGINLQFGWGNLTLQNGKYIDMHSAPELINIRGKVYRKN